MDFTLTMIFKKVPPSPEGKEGGNVTIGFQGTWHPNPPPDGIRWERWLIKAGSGHPPGAAPGLGGSVRMQGTHVPHERLQDTGMGPKGVKIQFKNRELQPHVFQRAHRRKTLEYRDSNTFVCCNPAPRQEDHSSQCVKGVCFFKKEIVYGAQGSR